MEDSTSPIPSSSSLTALSPKESSRFDPYAFTIDEHLSPQVKGASSYLGNGTMHLSVHPKTFLPPGNPSPHSRILPEKATEPLMAHFPLYLHSPIEGINSHLLHTSARLETETAVIAGDNKRHAVTQSHFHNIPSPSPDIVYHNGGSFLQAEVKMGTPKKKKKSKAVEAGIDGSKKTTKSKKSKDTATKTLVSMQTQASVDSFHMNTAFPGHSDMTVQTSGRSTPMTMSNNVPKDGVLFQALQGKGNMTSASSHPTTTSAATFTNSIRFVPDDRRHSNDSFEHSGNSRPASRTSTTSSTSTEGKVKEAADTISLSKILEIIEREKSLGSPSPCKRRRTAKPQHIQEAEEEAKKYAATNAVQGGLGFSPGADTLAARKKQEPKVGISAKKNLSALSPSEKSVVNVLTPPPAFHTELSHHSNDSSDGRSLQVQTFVDHSNLSALSNSASSSPVQTKTSSHSFSGKVLNSGQKEEQSSFSSHFKKLSLNSPNVSQTVAAANLVEKSSQVSQLFNPLAHTANGILYQSASRPPEVKDTFQLSPSLNTQVSCQPSLITTGILQTDTQLVQSPPSSLISPEIETGVKKQIITITQQSPQQMPTSPSPLTVSGNLSAIQRTTFQGLFPESPTSPTQWPGDLHTVLPPPQSVTPVDGIMMDVKVQDLEPSLTCDLNNSWSQTADFISGNDEVLHPSNSLTDLSNKKTKKKRSTNKTKTSQLSLLSQQSEAENSIGTLPPFGAFAGFKLEPLSFDLSSNDAVNIHSTDNGPKVTVKKKKQKKSLTPCEIFGKEQKSVISDTAGRQPMPHNSNLKLTNSLMDRNKFLVHHDGYLPTNQADVDNEHDQKIMTGDSKPYTTTTLVGLDIKHSTGLDIKFSSNNFMYSTGLTNSVQNMSSNLETKADAIKPPLLSGVNVNMQCVNGLTVKSADGSVTWEGNMKIPNNSLPQANQVAACYKKPQPEFDSVKCASPSYKNSATLMLSGERFSSKPKPDASLLQNGLISNGSTPLASPKGSPDKVPTSPLLKMEQVFMSPEEELDDRLRTNRVEIAPKCGCLGPNYEFNESIEGPYYTQLGTAKDMVELRAMMEKRVGVTGNALRLEKIHYTGKEGCTKDGCPIAKWIIRRSCLEEKYLCIARKRPGHFCSSAFIVVAVVAWEGVVSHQADTLYSYLVGTLTKNGLETDRRCGTNERKTCACQGVDLLRRGASFSFGCSWSMYFNGCKFGRSHIARKFKLKDTNEEEKLEEQFQELASKVAPLFKAVAPDAYRNQTYFEEQASMCRLGKVKGRPFSGVTACVDFCAHSHKDSHNMQNGSTVVVTLTKNRGLGKPDDEQLHVLPMYIIDNTDEHGSVEGQMRKVQSGALEILHKYPAQARLRATPLKKPKRGCKKDSPAKGGTLPVPTSPVTLVSGGNSVPLTPSKERDTSFFSSQDSNNSMSDGSEKSLDTPNSSFLDKDCSSAPGDFKSQNFGPSQVYEKVWDYFYTNGSFPPPSFVDRWVADQKEAMMNPTKMEPTNSMSSNGNQNGPHHLSQTLHAAGLSPDDSLTSRFSQRLPDSVFPQVRLEAANSDIDQEVITLMQKTDSRILLEGRISGSSTPFRPQSLNGIGVRNASPLDLLTESDAAMEAGVFSPPYRSQVISHSRPPSQASLGGEINPVSPSLPRPHSSPSVQHAGSGQSYLVSPITSPNSVAPTLCNENSSAISKTVIEPSGCFITPTLGQGPDEPTFTMMDPTVVRCEWQDNEESFHDPGVGGVAIALCHGAVLFEVAKRELHATTALKNPNRYQPTRMSLVFYQHKNLNYHHHGYYEYERKLATQRKKRIEKLMEEGASVEEAEKAVKPGRKRKKKDLEGEEVEEKVDFAKTSAAQYKYMWDTTVRHGISLTTDSIITRWIDPQPMVTGPYQRWV